MPSFDVASSCSVVIPLASKKAGIVLTLADAPPFSESQSETGVTKSWYVKKKVSDPSLVAVKSAVPRPGVGTSVRFQAPSSRESAVMRLFTLSSVVRSTRSFVLSTLASETRSLGSKSTSNRRTPRSRSSTVTARSDPSRYVLPPLTGVESLRSEKSSRSRKKARSWASSGRSSLTR